MDAYCLGNFNAFDIFRTIYKAVGFNWDFVLCLNLCEIYLLNQYHVHFGEEEAFVAMFLPYK